MVFKLLFLLSTSAIAASLRTTDFQQSLNAHAPRNFVINSGAEKNDLNVTDASNILSRTTTNPLEGDASFLLDATSSGQIVIFAGQFPQRGLLGQTCEARFNYLGDASLYKAYVQSAGATVSSEIQLINSGSSSQPVSIIFPCGGSITLDPTIVVESTSASAAAFRIDSLYIGKELSISNVSQAQEYGSASWALTSNCQWSTTSTSIASYAADTDCPTPSLNGFAVAPATKVPAVDFNNMPPGDYLVVATGYFGPGNTSTTAQMRYSLSENGVNSGLAFASALSGSALYSVGSSIVGRFNFSSYGNRRFEVRARTSSASNGAIIENATASDSPFKIVVYRYPSTSEIVVRADVVDLSGNTKSAATTNCVWTLTSGTMGSFGTDSDCPVPSVSGNLGAPATKIPATLAASILPGRYEVTAFGMFQATSGVSATTFCAFEIYDGTNSGGIQGVEDNTPGLGSSTTLTGVFNYTAAQSNVQFQVRAARVTGNGSCDVYGNSMDLSFVLKPISQSLTKPLIPGSMFSSSIGIEYSNRALIGGATANSTCSSSPCTVRTQSGSWVSSSTRTSTGVYVVNIPSGTYSVAPQCVVNGLNNSTSRCQVDTEGSTTIQNVVCRDSSNVVQDNFFNIICQGSK